MKNPNLRVAVVAAAVVNVTILGLIIALFLGGALTPRRFGIAGLSAIAVSGAVWYLALNFPPPLDANVSRNQGTKINANGFSVRVAVILALLVFSAWATRGGPWLPRLIGASMLMLFLIGALRSRRFPS